MRNKKLLTWFLIISCVLLVILGIAGWIVYSFFAKLRAYKTEVPAELREARITVGAEFLSRNQFVATNESWADFDPTKGLGVIKAIATGELDSQPGFDVVIAGSTGALIVDRNGVKRSQVQYELEVEKKKVFVFEAPVPRLNLGEMQVIDIEGDGACEFLARGSLDGAAVFSHQGKRLWSYGAFTKEKTSIDDLAAGDVNGDGVLEFIAAWDALELFDRHGRQRWTQPWKGPLYQIEVVDVDGDGKNEIIHSSGGEMTIRDGRGKVLEEVDMPFYFSFFHLCLMPGEKQPHILVVEDSNVWLVDFNGEAVKKFAAPLSSFDNPRKNSSSNLELFQPDKIGVFNAKGVWVKLKETQPAFLAVITEFAALDRSVLNVYSADGKLVYQEVMPEECLSIAALSAADERGAQELLVGGSGTVWRYTAR